MRRAILCTLIAVTIVLLRVTAAGALATDPVRNDPQYDPKAEQVFIGAVHDKPVLFEGRMYFTLRTSNGGFEVEIGPKEFVESRGLKLNSGQTVTVAGVLIVVRQREIVLARQVTIGDYVFVVRDRNGQPIWDMDRPIQMDPEVRYKTFPVC